MNIRTNMENRMKNANEHWVRNMSTNWRLNELPEAFLRIDWPVEPSLSCYKNDISMTFYCYGEGRAKLIESIINDFQVAWDKKEFNHYGKDFKRTGMISFGKIEVDVTIDGYGVPETCRLEYESSWKEVETIKVICNETEEILA